MGRTFVHWNSAACWFFALCTALWREKQQQSLGASAPARVISGSHMPLSSWESSHTGWSGSSSAEAVPIPQSPSSWETTPAYLCWVWSPVACWSPKAGHAPQCHSGTRRDKDEETECAGGRQSLAGLWEQPAPFTGGKKPLSHVFLMLLLDQSWLAVMLSRSHVPRVHWDASSQTGIADFLWEELILVMDPWPVVSTYACRDSVLISMPTGRYLLKQSIVTVLIIQQSLTQGKCLSGHVPSY